MTYLTESGSSGKKIKQTRFKCGGCKAILCGNDVHDCKGEFLRYYEGNYIYGTKTDFTLWRETGLIVDNKSKQIIKEVNDAECIFTLIREAPFHKRTENDRAQCCDQPYRVIEYGDDWVVSIDDASRLSTVLLESSQEAVISRMRAFSSMLVQKK